MDPLPTTQSSDAFAARWATLRARELVMLADGLRADRPVLAERLRRHAVCLAPELEAEVSLERPLRPEVAYRPKPKRPRPESDPLPALAVGADFAELDRAIAEADTEIENARFKNALDALARARSLLSEKPEGAQRRARNVKLEVMAATALVALGRSDDASESFARALRVQPDLELDAQTTPPKILRLLARTRAESRRSDRETRQ